MSKARDGQEPTIVTSLGTARVDGVEVLGHDLVHDLVGRLDFGSFVYLLLTGRLPDPHESRVTNALLVVLADHGFTPHAVAARLIYRCSPEAVQAAVAAGLLGAGSVYLGASENAARMLQQAVQDHPGEPAGEVARGLVAEHLREKRALPGIGHNLHRPVDPRAARLFAVAREEGIYAAHCELMEAVGREVETQTGRVLPVNVTGAIAAISSDMGLPWRLGKAFALVGRTAGLLAHLREEAERPVGDDLMRLIGGRVEYVRPASSDQEQR
jgi:citrate synthase